jgi:hypothetical protein
MNESGLTVFYLPRLDDAEIREALAWMFRVYDRAPRFCGWLADALMTEQAGRLESGGDAPRETDLLTLPFHLWTTEEIQQALSLVTALSYAVSSYVVGQLVDAIVHRLVAAAGARMLRLEERCQR